MNLRAKRTPDHFTFLPLPELGSGASEPFAARAELASAQVEKSGTVTFVAADGTKRIDFNFFCCFSIARVAMSPIV